jgi:hypothetical protein
MTREEYLEKSKEMQIAIKNLEHQQFEMRKAYINEHKQVKEELPVKIHYIHSSEKDNYTMEDDAYIKRFDMFDYKYYEYYTTYHIDQPFHPSDGLVYPVLIKAKKDGSMSRFELHYPKCGTFKFWVVGKEDEVYEIDFGR